MQYLVHPPPLHLGSLFNSGEHVKNRITSNKLTSTLNQQFGIPGFRPGQQDAIEHILSGEDILVVMPTGYGKSLIYQLAALLLPNTTLVVSPLISLMKDQVDSLNRSKIPASFINSSLNPAEQRDRLNKLAKGSYKILLVAPERLRSRAFKNALAGITVSMLVVDEAHCLSQWGHDFRPDYLHIAKFSQQCKDPILLALTATATQKVQNEIIQLLQRQDMEKVITGFNRPNLAFEVIYLPDLTDKLRFIDQFLSSSEGPGIIYTGTRRDAEEVAEFISQVVGSPAYCYHGGLDLATRNEVQDLFMSGDLDFVSATNAFGMGIDRPDVRFVMHYSMPGSIEAYYQEAGRAGRDGKPARAILLYSPDDIALQEFFINNDTPSMEELRMVYHYITNLPIQPNGSINGTRRFRLDELILKTALTEVKARVAIEQIEGAGGFSRQPNEFGNLICVRVQDLSDKELQRIHSGMETRRQHKRAVLENMVNYAETNDCRRQKILEYFGDKSYKEIPNCCDNCKSRKDTDNRDFRFELGTEQAIILETISKLRWGIGKSKLSLILKGSSAKKVARYRKRTYFGIFNGQLIREIEFMIENLIQESYIKSIGNPYPTLVLTPKGEISLRNHRSVELEKSPIQPVKQPTITNEGNKLTRSQTPPGRISKQKDRAAYIHSLGVLGSVSDLPELIPALKDPNGNVRRMAASALGKMKACEAVEPLLALLDVETKPQVRQYSIKALGKIGDERARKKLEQIATDFSEKDYNRKSARTALLKIKEVETNQPVRQSVRAQHTETNQINLSPRKPKDSVHAFLSKHRPRPLNGPWLAGWALDYHSRYQGHNHIRSTVGNLVYNYKYKGEHHLVTNLVQLWIELLAQHPELPQPHAIIPIPSSKTRSIDPVKELAQELAAKLHILAMIDTLSKTRNTQQQKELNTLVAKQKNVSGAYQLSGSIKGRHILLIDDLYDSGATLNEAARTLAQGQPTSIVVLTLTKTIHSNL